MISKIYRIIIRQILVPSLPDTIIILNFVIGSCLPLCRGFSQLKIPTMYWITWCAFFLTTQMVSFCLTSSFYCSRLDFLNSSMLVCVAVVFPFHSCIGCHNFSLQSSFNENFWFVPSFWWYKQCFFNRLVHVS